MGYLKFSKGTIKNKNAVTCSSYIFISCRTRFRKTSIAFMQQYNKRICSPKVVIIWYIRKYIVFFVHNFTFLSNNFWNYGSDRPPPPKKKRIEKLKFWKFSSSFLLFIVCSIGQFDWRLFSLRASNQQLWCSSLDFILLLLFFFF